MPIKIDIYDLYLQRDIPEDMISPIQTHSANIVEIKTVKENLENCDGIFTSAKNNYPLSIKTADCAAICFHNDQRYGIIHAGWRGLVNGIVEKMISYFDSPDISVAPVLKEFEIQKDQCWEQINRKFGTEFFKVTENGQIIFQFQEALKSILPINAKFDERDTRENKNLASWRRDKNTQRNYTVISNKIGDVTLN